MIIESRHWTEIEDFDELFEIYSSKGEYGNREIDSFIWSASRGSMEGFIEHLWKLYNKKINK